MTHCDTDELYHEPQRLDEREGQPFIHSWRIFMRFNFKKICADLYILSLLEINVLIVLKIHEEE